MPKGKKKADPSTPVEGVVEGTELSEDNMEEFLAGDDDVDELDATAESDADDDPDAADETEDEAEKAAAEEASEEESQEAEEEARAAEAAAAEEERAKQEAAQAAEAEAKAKAEAEAQAAAAQEAAQAQPAQEPAQPAQPTPTPQEMEAAAKKWQEDTEVALTSHYNLTEDELAVLDEEPAKLIPRLMARAHMNAYLAAVQFMQQNGPALVERALHDREVYSEIEQKFQTRWPELDIKGAHKDTVQKLGLAYRQANPAASTDDFIQHVGAQATLALKLNGGQPAAPAAPATPTPPAQPFQPAATTKPGTGGGQTPANPFTAMAEEMMAEDMDLDN